MSARQRAIVIDAANPDALRDFWVAATSWIVLADPEGNEFCLVYAT